MRIGLRRLTATKRLYGAGIVGIQKEEEVADGMNFAGPGPVAIHNCLRCIRTIPN